MEFPFGKLLDNSAIVEAVTYIVQFPLL